MPFYQFTVPADSATARKKAEVAAAVTAVHAEVTRAPSQYVNCRALLTARPETRTATALQPP